MQQARIRKAVRPCNQTPAHTHARNRTAYPRPLGDYYAHMAVDCIIALALLKAVPWLEVDITRQALATLGDRPRRSCVLGTAIRLTRERARLEGWPWPSFDDVVTLMAMAEIRKEKQP